jgi:NDP-sugar pyrophosphorylase family protein
VEIGLIILAGGAGTRIRPVIGTTPKLLAPIGEQPFVHWLMKWVAQWDIQIKNTYLAGGIGYEQVKSYLDICYPRMQLFVEPCPLGTLGAALNIIATTDNTHYIIINGDTLFSIDMSSFVSCYLSNGNDAALLALKSTDRCEHYGSYFNKGDGWVYSDSGRGHAISMGMLIASRELFLSQHSSIFASGTATKKTIRSALAKLAPLMIDIDFCARVPLKGFVLGSETLFIDIGTPSAYSQAQGLIPCMI